MTKDPFKDMRRTIDQARLDHQRAMDDALEQIQAALSFAQAEMRAARIEFRAKMDEARRRLDGIRRGEQRRRRRDPGDELEPVSPKPKPPPLVDGAEAPIE